MARTTKSRGKTNFKLDNSPYPLFKGLKNVAKKIGGGIAGVLGGGEGGGGEGGSLGERLDRIEQKLDQENASSEQSGDIGGSGTISNMAGGVNSNMDGTMANAEKDNNEEEEMLQKEV